MRRDVRIPRHGVVFFPSHDPYRGTFGIDGEQIPFPVKMKDDSPYIPVAASCRHDRNFSSGNVFRHEGIGTEYIVLAVIGVKRIAVVGQKFVASARYDEVDSSQPPGETDILLNRLQVAQNDDYACPAIFQAVDLPLNRGDDVKVHPHVSRR